MMDLVGERASVPQVRDIVGKRVAVAKNCVVLPALIWAAASFSAWGLARAADSRSPITTTTTAEPGQAAEVARLVRELGAATFMARQHAQRALVAIGPIARPAVEAACQDPDHEIRQRARQVLAAIADVDFHARLRAFLADQDAENGHGLAGWQRYRSLAGATPASRRLFADMQRAERELLDAVAEAPAKAGALLDERCQQVEHLTQDGDSSRPSQLSLATTAALLFAASNPDVPISGHAGNCLHTVGNQTALAQALNTRPAAVIIRGLLNAWISRPFERDSLTAYRNLLLAMQYNLKDAVQPALALLGPPGGPSNLEPFAILTIGKLGGPEHLPALEPILKDERAIDAVDRGGQKSNTQIRDVALAAMIHLTRQKLSDYGFAHAKTHPYYLFNTNTLGFNDPAAREAALKKWLAWAEKQSK